MTAAETTGAVPLLSGAEEEAERRPGGPAPALTIAVVAAILVGAGLRIWVLASHLGTADSDEAVVGLMARHVLDGDLPAFFWGQAHGGVQEPVLAAAVFALFGPSVLALKMVPVALAAATALLVRAVGRRTIGEPGATVAAALTWAAPTAAVWFSTKARGFYGAVSVLGLVALLTALRLRDRAWWPDAAALGLACGFGWYASPQIVFVVVPCLAWLAVTAVRDRRWELLRLWWVLGLGVVVGALPWLVANLGSDWASLTLPTVPVATSYLDRLELLFRTGLPILLGLKVPFAAHWVLPVLGPVLYLAALAGLLYAVVRWRHRRVAMLLVIAAAYPFLAAAPASSFYMVVPRYLLHLWPVLALLLARALTPASARLQVGAVVAVVGLSVVGTVSLSSWGRAHPHTDDLAVGELGPLLHILEDEGVDTAFAEYWVAYRIAFESDEAVIAASLGQVRHPPYQERVRASPRPAYVLFRGSVADGRLGPALDRLGVRHRRSEAGRFAVYLPERAVMPEQVAGVW